MSVAAAWDKKDAIEITAYRGNDLVYDEMFFITDKKSKHLELNIKGAYVVYFEESLYKDDPKSPHHAAVAVFDDFVFAHVNDNGGASAHGYSGTFSGSHAHDVLCNHLQIA